MWNHFYKTYCKVEEVIVGVGFSAIVLLTFGNAVLRMFDMPIVVADDLCLLLFSWTALLGSDVALRYSRLVGMDILVRKFPPKVQKILQIVVYAVMIAVLAMLISGGIKIIQTNGARPYNTLPVPYGFVTASLPVCGSLMVFTCLEKIVRVIRNFKNDEYQVRKDNPIPVGEENTGLDALPMD